MIRTDIDITNKEHVLAALTDYITAVQANLLVDFNKSSMVNDTMEDLSDIRRAIALHKTMTAHKSRLESLNVRNCGLDVDSLVEAFCSEIRDVKLQPYKEKLSELERTKQGIIDGTETDYLMRLGRAKEEYNEIRRKRLEVLDEVKYQLTEVSDSLTDMDYLIEIYGLTKTKYSLDVEQMSLTEFKQLLLLSQSAVRLINSKTVFSSIQSILYLPLVFTIHKHEDLFTTLYCTMLFFLLAAFSDYIFAVIGIAFIINTIMGIKNGRENRELIQVAYLLKNNKDDIVKDLEKKLLNVKSIKDKLAQKLELEMEDVTSLIKEAIAEIEIEIEEAKDSFPYDSLDEFDSYVHSEGVRGRIDYLVNSTFENCDSYRVAAIKTLTKHISKLEEFLKGHSDNFKPIGKFYEPNQIIANKFLYDYEMYREYTIDYCSHPIPTDNIVFLYKTDEERLRQISFIKHLYVSISTQTDVQQLITTVYDPLYVGEGISEFFSNDTESIFKLATGTFEELFQSINNISRDNMYKLSNKTFTEYNEESIQSGRALIPYRLYILLSDGTPLYDKQEFIAMLKVCVSRGIIFWIMQKDVVDKNGEIKTLHLPCESIEAYKLSSTSGRFDFSSQNPYTVSLGLTTKETLTYAVKNAAAPAINYEKMYREKFIPDDKIWTHTTLDGIELRFGFLDGDLNKPYSEMLGDDAVHALMAGQTGAGKSVVINVLLASLLHMYSPEWLQLVMVDFKRVEFAMYTGANLIPHASIISGTKDGEYSVSIFDWVLDEMARRNKLFSKYQCQKIKDFNSRILKGEITDQPIVPRILLLFDEFQAMFIAVSEDKLDIIKKRIMALAREARAAGVHMLFTSQSMGGTISEEVLDQFKLRVSLANTSAISKQVLGNEAAASLVGKGWLYLNQQGGKIQYNKLYRVPFASNDYIREYLPRIIKRTLDTGMIHRHAEWYDEEQLFGIDKMNEYYGKYDVVKEDQAAFLIGEPTNYSTNALPVNFRLMNGDGEHVAICSFETKDTANLLKTFLENLKYKKSRIVFASAFDSDLFTLTGIENHMSAQAKEFTHKYKAAELIQALYAQMNMRMENPGTYPDIYYFIIGFDKIPDLESNYSLWEGIFIQLLQFGPTYGIHIIASFRDPKLTRKMCNYTNHKICAKTTENYSSMFIEKSLASRINEGLALYLYGTDITKFKIYQFELDTSLVREKSLTIKR